MEKILNEVIQYTETRSPGKCLSKAHENMDRKALYVICSHTLSWLEMGRLNDPEIEDPEKMDIDTLSGEYARNVALLLQHCPEMGQLIKADANFIYFADGFSETEKNEIRDYVHEHAEFKLQLGPRRSRRNDGN